MSTPPTQPNYPNPQSDPVDAFNDPEALPQDELVDRYEEEEFEDEMSPADLEKEQRAERRKRHVRMFCFSCNRYEGHSVAARSRLFYSFLIGFTFGLYHYLGRYSCHCCGTVRLARKDWLNLRFWYRTLWIGGSTRNKNSSSKPKSRSRRKS